MWEKIIFIDYDVGAFGNTILTLLLTTSESALGAFPYNSIFSPIGDSHRIRNLNVFSKFEFQLTNSPPPIIPESCANTGKYLPIIGHAYGNEQLLKEEYPDSTVIRIVTDRDKFSLQQLAGFAKFSGPPTVANMDSFDSESWKSYEHSENGMIECLSSNYFHYLKNCGEFKIPALKVKLSDILNSDFGVLIAMFEDLFGFVFNAELVADLVKNWKKTNQIYVDRSQILETIVKAIVSNEHLDLSQFKLINYEKAIIISLVAYDLNFDIRKYPFYDEMSWLDTNELCIITHALQKE